MIDKLVKVQSELKAPKSQRNNFGKYNYRNCEDILEAVKPLLNKYGLAADYFRRGKRKPFGNLCRGYCISYRRRKHVYGSSTSGD